MSASFTSIYPPEVIDEINQRIEIRRMMQSIDYKFDKYQDSQKTVKCFCPIHCEGLFRNLIIDKEQRTFRCLYTQCPGSSGGNLVELYALSKKLAFDDALRELVQEQGLGDSLPVDTGILERSLKEAEARLDEGDFDQAETLYRQILEAEPTMEQPYFALLKIYGDEQPENRYKILRSLTGLLVPQGRLPEIADEIQKWAQEQPDDNDARIAVAEVTFLEGDAESAVMEFMAAADACEVSGNLTGAITAYGRVEEISRQHNLDIIDAVPHVVRNYTQAGRHQEATKYLLAKVEEAHERGDFPREADLLAASIDLDPDSTLLRSRFVDAVQKCDPNPNLASRMLETAEFFSQRDDHEAAIRALTAYVESAPEDEDALQKLIEISYTHGQPNEAADLEAHLARRHHTQGRGADARERIQKILHWNQDHVASLGVLAEIEADEGNAEAAREARRRQAKSLTGKREYERAAEVLEDMLRTEPNAIDLIEQLAINLETGIRAGQEQFTHRARELFEKLGDDAGATSGRRATQFLERATSLGQAPASLLFKLASVYMRQNMNTQARDTVILGCEALAAEEKLDQAILEAERYADLMPLEPDLVRYLAELYLRVNQKSAAVTRLRRLADELAGAGRSAEATEIIDQALMLEPEDLPTLFAQAEVHRKSGNKDKHMEMMLKMVELHEGRGEMEEAMKALAALAKSTGDLKTMSRLVQMSEKAGETKRARKWRIRLAASHRAAHDHDREARALRDSLTKSPDDEELLQLLIEAEFARRDSSAAAQQARRLAGIQQRADRNADAIKTLRQTLRQAPDHLDLNRELFNLLRNGDQPDDALEVGKKLASLLAAAGRSLDAATVYEQLVQLQPSNGELMLDQVKFLESIGRGDEAGEKRRILAEQLREEEKYDEAETLLQDVLAANTQDVAARRALAELYRHLGQEEKADEQLAALANSYDLEGDPAKAVETLTGILHKNPENLNVRRQLVQAYLSQDSTRDAVRELLMLADVLRQQNMEGDALRAEREAVELAPFDTATRRRLAEGLHRTGRADQATDELEHIVAHLLESDKLDEARQVLDDILTIQPNKLNSRRMRAELLTQMGDNEAALEEYRTIATLAASSTGAKKSSDVSTQQPDISTYRLQLVHDYDFGRFVVGGNNNFAYATAMAIAKSPARAYNPFFIYADVGLGKTHLCNAIANYILESDPKARIIYTNSEDFTGELVEAIQNNSVQQFRSLYRSVDLLVVDDVQFLAGKERAQEEFFHIFNALFQAKRQIVVTSDRPPSEIAHLENRLRSRFGAGVIVDIASPDVETRTAILKREVEMHELGLDANTCRIVAERIDTNVRDLKGALNQVVAMRDLRGQELNEENITKMLDTFYVRAS